MYNTRFAKVFSIFELIFRILYKNTWNNSNLLKNLFLEQMLKKLSFSKNLSDGFLSYKTIYKKPFLRIVFKQTLIF